MDLTLTLPEDRIADLLCSGFEGGISYWAYIVGDRKPRSVVDLGPRWDDGIFPHVHFPLSRGGAVTVCDLQTEKKHTLDLGAIRRGLRVMAEKFPRHFGDWLAENDDATTGDVFIQCCLLGDIVYG